MRIQTAIAASKKVATKGVVVLKKYSPEILTGVGIVAGVTAAVLGAKATLKVEPIVKKLEEETSVAKQMRKEVPETEYSQKEYIQDLTGSYLRFGLEMAENYGPAVATGLLSIASILGAHGIMRKRNAALAVALNAVDTAFNAYRARVIEEFGEEKDREYRFGVRNETVEDEKGKTKIVTHKDRPEGSPYVRCFSELTAKMWSPDPAMNIVTLKNVQNNLNDLLHARGHVFLNEAWDRLGMERTPDGQVVGWTLNTGGDNYIDFGIWDMNNTRARMFVNGIEDTVWLDPNVDGSIIDKI